MLFFETKFPGKQKHLMSFRPHYTGLSSTRMFRVPRWKGVWLKNRHDSCQDILRIRHKSRASATFLKNVSKKALKYQAYQADLNVPRCSKQSSSGIAGCWLWPAHNHCTKTVGVLQSSLQHMPNLGPRHQNMQRHF